MDILREAIKAKRERNGITQSDVCNAIGLTQSAYSRFENGGDVRLSNLLLILTYLEIKIRIED